MSYRYIGNKTRLVPKLIEVISSLVPAHSTIADPMCGTASVSEGLRTAGFKVISSDIMTYSLHHARVRLLMDAPPAFAGMDELSYYDIIQELQMLEPVKGFFYKEFSPSGKPKNCELPRKYFTPENAASIDAITQRINELVTTGLITDFEESLLRHDLILAANRVANIAGTYGHFRSKWSSGSKAKLMLKPAEFNWGFSCDHIVLNGPIEEVSKEISADLCYMDPPYMKRQYAANYHIIETIAKGDRPEAIGVSGLRNWWGQYSDFCSKVKIRSAFESVFKNMDCNKFVISYSEDGLLKRDDLIDFFSDFGSLKVFEIENQRFKSNSSGKGGKLKEYLFYLRV